MIICNYVLFLFNAILSFSSSVIREFSSLFFHIKFAANKRNKCYTLTLVSELEAILSLFKKRSPTRALEKEVI